MGYELARGGVLLAQLGKQTSPPTPEVRQNVPAFNYDAYCDAQGRFIYDGAALALIRKPEHLRQAYSDADRGQPRAKELIRELEQIFRDFGTWAADQTTHPRCLPLRELTPGCQPNWQILDDLLGQTAEATQLRRVVAEAYEVRARRRGAENAVILEAVNLLMAAGLAKGLINKAAAMELQAPAEAAAQGAAAKEPTRFIDGVTVTPRAGPPMTGTVDLKPTLDRIKAGGSFPHRNDGSTFGNKEGCLPAKPQGYYREYVHPTPGENGLGPQRVIVGQGGEMYYTPDHYRTFIPINP